MPNHPITNPANETSLPPLPLVMSMVSLFLSLVILWMAVHSNIMGRKSEDDLNYLYYSSTASIDTAKFQEIGKRVSEFLNKDAKDSYYAYRFDERQRVVDNYPLLSFVVKLVRASVLPELAGGQKTYPSVLTQILNISLHTTIALTLLCFTACLPLVRREWLPGVALGLVVILAMDWYFPWQPPLWILHARPQGIAEVIERAIHVLLLVFSTAGIASDFPRGNFLVLIVPVFLLRWSSRYSSSYALAAIATVVHSAMGALLVMCLLATDLLLRREVLRSPAVLATIASVSGLILSRSLIAKTLSIQTDLLTAGLALGAGVVIAALLWYISMARQPAFVDVLARRLARHGPILSDFMVIYGMWLVVLPISVFMYFHVGAPQNMWTWGELPGRFLLMMRGPLLVGTAILFVGILQRLGATWSCAVASVSLVAACGLLIPALNLPNVLATTPPALPKQFAAREQTALQAEQGKLFEYVEADVYFAAARSIDLGNPFPSGLLTYTSAACRRRYSSCE